MRDIKFNETFYESMNYTYLPEIVTQWLSVANMVMKFRIQSGTEFHQVISKERLIHYLAAYSSPTQVLIHLTLKDANDRKGVDTTAI